MTIPISLRKMLDDDAWMHRCCYKGCGMPAQWHHVFTYAKKSIQEEFNIVPACPKHHAMATTHGKGTLADYDYVPEVKEYFEWVAIQRMDGHMLSKYPKKDWIALTNYLIIKSKEYGW